MSTRRDAIVLFRWSKIRVVDSKTVASLPTSKIVNLHLLGLSYLFNLCARFPELATPQDWEALSPEGVRQADELCKKWFARQRFTLDRSP